MSFLSRRVRDQTSPSPLEFPFDLTSCYKAYEDRVFDLALEFDAHAFVLRNGLTGVDGVLRMVRGVLRAEGVIDFPGEEEASSGEEDPATGGGWLDGEPLDSPEDEPWRARLPPEVALRHGPGRAGAREEGCRVREGRALVDYQAALELDPEAEDAEEWRTALSRLGE